MKTVALAIAALIPLASGTTAHDASESAITVALCNGGEITIDLGTGDEPPERDCHAKGCHAGACREKLKGKPARPV